MKLDRVTFTGADDSVSPRAVVAFWEKYPYTEFGILFAKDGGKWAQCPRFPSAGWVNHLLNIAPTGMKLCAHLCGGWVDDIMLWDHFTFGKVQAFDPKRFQRAQLNFHASEYDFTQPLKTTLNGLSPIFQVDGVNNNAITDFVTTYFGSPLFDTSGGAGLTPSDLEEAWPVAVPGTYCGYAGGLSPDNVEDEVQKIINVNSALRYHFSTFWIDMETKVRSSFLGRKRFQFDLGLCEEVCKKVSPFMLEVS